MAKGHPAYLDEGESDSPPETVSNPQWGSRSPAGLSFLDELVANSGEMSPEQLDELSGGNQRERTLALKKGRARLGKLRERAAQELDSGQRGEPATSPVAATKPSPNQPRFRKFQFPSPLTCLRTGWREWHRSQRRRELERERRRILGGLAHLEARLGVLEWARLERREELRRPIGRIQRVERIHERQEERLLYVEGALRELNREEERLRKKEQVTLERLDDQITNLEERDRHAEKRLAEIDQHITRLDNRLMELDEEDTRVIANLSDLQLAGIETEEDEEQRVELEERRRAIPKEQSSLEQERDELEAEAERRQREKEALYERLLALEGERRQSARHFNRAQRRLESRREALRRRFQSTDESARHLRRQVWEPYQEVGAHLADAGVNAVQQPYLLGGIRALRAEVEEIGREIADLSKASMAESRLEKAICALIWLVLGIGVPAALVAIYWYTQHAAPVSGAPVMP